MSSFIRQQIFGAMFFSVCSLGNGCIHAAQRANSLISQKSGFSDSEAADFRRTIQIYLNSRSTIDYRGALQAYSVSSEATDFRRTVQTFLNSSELADYRRAFQVYSASGEETDFRRIIQAYFNSSKAANFRKSMDAFLNSSKAEKSSEAADLKRFAQAHFKSSELADFSRLAGAYLNSYLNSDLRNFIQTYENSSKKIDYWALQVYLNSYNPSGADFRRSLQAYLNASELTDFKKSLQAYENSSEVADLKRSMQTYLDAGDAANFKRSIQAYLDSGDAADSRRYMQTYAEAVDARHKHPVNIFTVMWFVKSSWNKLTNPTAKIPQAPSSVYDLGLDQALECSRLRRLQYIQGLNESSGSNASISVTPPITEVQQASFSAHTPEVRRNEYEEKKEGEQAPADDVHAANSSSSSSASTATRSRVRSDRTALCKDAKQSIANHKQNQKNDSYKNDLYPDTTPINEALMESVLNICPPKITRIIKLLQRKNLNPKAFPRKLLLVGLPGTGKTTICKAIAAKSGIPFKLFEAGAIANEYKNSGSKNLERIFADAAQQSQPFIIVFDELEALIKQYNNSNDTESRMLMILWQLLDKYSGGHILFIGTLNDVTSAPNMIKSRFKNKYIVDVPLPNSEQREKLIAHNMSLYPEVSFNIDCKRNDVNMSSIFGVPFSQCNEKLSEILARETSGFSHRDLDDLILELYEIVLEKQDNSQEVSIEDCCFQALGETKKSSRLVNKPAHEKLKEFLDKWGPSISAIGTLINTGNSIYSTVQQHKSSNFQKAAHKEGMDAQDRSFTFQQDAHREAMAHQERSAPLVALQKDELESKKHGFGWAKENMLPWAQFTLNVASTAASVVSAFKKNK